ncbi:MAG: addiction module antidote protein, HigA family [Elusimicrobia bacterium RIFCSPLOWO2_12_FULL_59_9]|nr:MAG: addiction module antidote protein, HigA family [Elusimicrobia bacterium RIFCSPLOWO2_12_FULL_59_9]
MRIPRNRPPTPPGEVLREDFLKPLGLTQEHLAEEVGVSFQRINGIINGKRALTAETAVLLAGRFKTSAGFWMNFQTRYDLYQAREKLLHRSAIARKYAALVTH